MVIGHSKRSPRKCSAGRADKVYAAPIRRFDAQLYAPARTRTLPSRPSSTAFNHSTRMTSVRRLVCALLCTAAATAASRVNATSGLDAFVCSPDDGCTVCKACCRMRIHPASDQKSELNVQTSCKRCFVQRCKQHAPPPTPLPPTPTPSAPSPAAPHPSVVPPLLEYVHDPGPAGDVVAVVLGVFTWLFFSSFLISLIGTPSHNMANNDNDADDARARDDADGDKVGRDATFAGSLWTMMASPDGKPLERSTTDGAEARLMAPAPVIFRSPWFGPAPPTNSDGDDMHLRRPGATDTNQMRGADAKLVGAESEDARMPATPGQQHEATPNSARELECVEETERKA